MKTLPITSALRKLADLKSRFRKTVAEGFEQRAKDCLTCDQQGICCTDAHFVNVHVTRLESEAIRERLHMLPAKLRLEVVERAEQAVQKYGLDETENSFLKTYSCPLFEPGTGCLVHGDTKPLPCIHHACYESPEDLPPQQLLDESERQVERLNARIYGNAWNWQPIPVWLKGLGKD